MKPHTLGSGPSMRQHSGLFSGFLPVLACLRLPSQSLSFSSLYTARASPASVPPSRITASVPPPSRGSVHSDLRPSRLLSTASVLRPASVPRICPPSALCPADLSTRIHRLCPPSRLRQSLLPPPSRPLSTRITDCFVFESCCFPAGFRFVIRVYRFGGFPREVFAPCE